MNELGPFPPSGRCRFSQENARTYPQTAGANTRVRSLTDRHGVAIGTAVDILSLCGEVISTAVEADPNGCGDNHYIVMRASDTNIYRKSDLIGL